MERCSGEEGPTRLYRDGLSTAALSPPIQNRTANAAGRRFYARDGGERPEQVALRSHDADFTVRHLDPLGQRPQVIAAIAAAVEPDPLAGSSGELPDHGGGDGLLARTFQHDLGAFGIGLGLIPNRFEAGDTLL